MNFRNLVLPIILVLVMATPTNGEDSISGRASWYQCTSGWCDGTATVALAGFLGGRHTGHINGYVKVCADRCATLPVVDYCQCYQGTTMERIIDLNEAAWPLVTNQPYSTGVINVTMTILEGGAVPQKTPVAVPNTAMK